MTQRPLPLLSRAVKLWFKGRIHRLKDVENIAWQDDGETFAAFRKVVVDPAGNQPDSPGAIFQVRFAFKNLPGWANRLLSLIPIPLICAQPGFRSKTWLLGQDSGDFIGYYEFDTVEEARAYWDSLPLNMMKKRAAEGSLSHEITPR